MSDEENDQILSEQNYMLLKGKQYNAGTLTWEYISRNNKVEAVLIIAIIYDKLILIANHRPPVENYVLEFPGGLVDRNETPIEAALRELKEETGYTADESHVTLQSPLLYPDPWKSVESHMLFRIEIDPQLEENAKLEQDLDEIEDIKVEFVKLSRLQQDIDDLVKEKGYFMDSRMYMFTRGFTMG